MSYCVELQEWTKVKRFCWISGQGSDALIYYTSLFLWRRGSIGRVVLPSFSCFSDGNRGVNFTMGVCFNPRDHGVLYCKYEAYLGWLNSPCCKKFSHKEKWNYGRNIFRKRRRTERGSRNNSECPMELRNRGTGKFLSADCKLGVEYWATK